MLLAHSRLCHRTPTAVASPPGAGEVPIQRAPARGASSARRRGADPAVTGEGVVQRAPARERSRAPVRAWAAGAGEGLGSGLRRWSVHGRRRGPRQRAPSSSSSLHSDMAGAAPLPPCSRSGRRRDPHPDPLTAAPSTGGGRGPETGGTTRRGGSSACSGEGVGTAGHGRHC